MTTTNQTGTGNLVLATSPTLVTPILGVASATSLTTSGQGALQVGPYGSSAGNTGEGRFLELLANGTNYTGFKSPDLLAGNVIYTLPSADGTSGQVLTTDGAGTLSWTTKTEGISQDFKGLSLRTSPNADVAATTVVLDHADEIVMDTGNRVATWDDLSAIITTAGAGGLDTGSEAASTWYEIYAIRKSSDGTKNLLLHRAKDYFLDEQQTTQDNGASLRQASAPTRTQLAQGFQTSNTGYVEFVDLRISQDNGTISGRVWLTIEADSSGNPSGTPLATSDKIDAESINTSSQWVRFVFRTPVSVTAATQYHLVLSGDYTPNDTVNIGWKADATGDYANGVWKSLDSGTWNTITGYDAMFKIYVTQNNTSVTLPSGYDQKAHVGYVYNGSDSNFIKFTAQGRHVWYMPDNSNGPDWVALSTSATVPTLTSLVAFVPPGPVRFIFTAQNDNATGSTIIGGVSSPGAGTSDYGGFYMIEDAANDQEISPPVQTEYQAFYMRALTAGTSYILPRQYEWGSGGGADLAEEYLVDDESISAGDVVSLTDEKLYVEKASMTGKTVLGIVSTKPGITLKDWPNDISPENTRPIALSGRVPVKISNENGEIKVGDRLTLSKTIPGYAMKQTDPGQSIGIAMESSLGKDKVLTFVNLSYWAPGFGSFEVNEDGTQTGNSFFDSILSFFKNAFEIVFEKGILKIANILANVIESKKIITEELQMKDAQTGEIYCVTIKNGEFDKVPGECVSAAAPQPSDEQTSEAEPQPDENITEEPETGTLTEESTPESEPEVTPEPALESEPEATTTEPQPEPDSTSSPQATSETTSEPPAEPAP